MRRTIRVYVFDKAHDRCARLTPFLVLWSRYGTHGSVHLRRDDMGNGEQRARCPGRQCSAGPQGRA